MGSRVRVRARARITRLRNTVRVIIRVIVPLLRAVKSIQGKCQGAWVHIQ